MADALVSVGLPVRNERARLQTCLRCVQAQKYPNIEICISDNDSSDGTYRLAVGLASEDDLIQVIRQHINVGPLENFNAVRRMSQGKYFMWLGADDRIEPNYLAKMVAQLESHPQAVVVQSAVRRGGADDPTGEVRFIGNVNPNFNSLLRQGMHVLTPYKNVRRLKFNLFVYGLYRKDFLDEVYERLGNPLNLGDRVLPALAALSGGMRYVDDFLFVKGVHAKSHRARRPEDPTFKIRQQHAKVSLLLRWFLTCPTIPWWRRLHGLIITAPFIAYKILGALKGVGLPIPAGTKIEF
jgi:glycosyltransferase involved in cell wall biosynthesis